MKARIILVLAACGLLPLAGRKLVLLAGAAVEDARGLAQPYAVRRLAAYGNCDGLGVGYLERVLNAIPDPTLLPLLRHRTAQPLPSSLLAGPVRRVDPRILVGIDVAPGDAAFAAELSGSPAPALPAGYTVVGGEGRCFVAVREDFLATLRAGQDPRWTGALERIGRAGSR